MEIKIIYQDNDLLVVDKPAGLPAAAVPQALQAGVVFPIHRLDKNTSGVLLIAKTEKGLFFYQKQFSDKSKGLEKILKKRYIALVVGNVQNNEGRIETLIGRGVNDRKKQKVYLPHEPNIKGKREAITEYKVIERFDDYTLLEVFPRTGRKHQIRAHLSYINHPIVGDKVYGFKNQLCPKDLDQHFLHAKCIKLEMLNGEIKEFCSELPNNLQNIVNKLSKINYETSRNNYKRST